MLSVDKADAEARSLEKATKEEERKKAGDVTETVEASCPQHGPKEGEDSTENLLCNGPASKNGEDDRDIIELTGYSPASKNGEDDRDIIELTGYSPASEDDGDIIELTGYSPASEDDGDFIELTGYSPASEDDGDFIELTGYSPASEDDGDFIELTGYSPASEDDGDFIELTGYSPASEDGGDIIELTGYSPASEEEDGGRRMIEEQEADTFLLLDGDKMASQKCLTPDFSDSETFFNLLCRFQSRRMNDQRCSFRRKPRGDNRPWKSAPSSPVRERRAAVFASVMSLQTEEFFDLVAWSQARRLDDQRAEPLDNEPQARESKDEKGTGDLPEREGRKTWKKVRQHVVTEPCRVPDEELYNTILTHQSERIEEQRSDPPLPLAARDLFDLLLRLQGERMDEQRVELPTALLRREVNLC